VATAIRRPCSLRAMRPGSGAVLRCETNQNISIFQTLRSGSALPDLRAVRGVAEDIVVAIDEVLNAGHPTLLLFGHGMERVHERFTTEFQMRRHRHDYMLAWRGERISSHREFYDECVHLMPDVEAWFGRNLDALDEILRSQGLGIARDPRNRTYWVWENAHVLLEHDKEFFRKLYPCFVEDAKDVNAGSGLGGIGDSPFPAQRVSLLLTGRLEPMRDLALDGDSFLHLTRWWQYRPQPPPEPTGLVTFTVSE